MKAPYTEFSYTKADLSLLPPRTPRSHKGTYGRVLLICGSSGMAGAAYLAALGAYRSGAGLCEIFTPEENRIILQTLIPEAVLTVYDTADFDAEIPNDELLRARMEAADAIVIGCGLGKSRAALKLLRTVLTYRTVPTVLDADALNLLSGSPSLLARAEGCVITPHQGEMARLCGKEVEEIEQDRSHTAYAFAHENSLICALKGHRTVVSDGSERLYINRSGNSGMATAGAGDVLAGMLGSLLAQARHTEQQLLDTVALGVYLHGLAGDAAAQHMGAYALMASDIASHVGVALQQAAGNEVLI